MLATSASPLSTTPPSTLLNRQYLQHDYPTDVLSFVLEEPPPGLEGEVIVSADTAVAQSGEYAVQSGKRVAPLRDSWCTPPGGIRRPESRLATADALC